MKIKYYTFVVTSALALSMTIPLTTSAITTSNNRGNLAFMQERFKTGKLEACQSREKAIDNIMSRLSNRGTKQLYVFTTISDRVQTFYHNKGKVLNNYSELVAAVDEAKISASNAVAKTNETSVTFRCGGTDPRGAVTVFKSVLEIQNQKLQDFKNAVKNLVVEVKSVQETTN